MRYAKKRVEACQRRGGPVCFPRAVRTQPAGPLARPPASRATSGQTLVRRRMTADDCAFEPAQIIRTVVARSLGHLLALAHDRGRAGGSGRTHRRTGERASERAGGRAGKRALICRLRRKGKRVSCGRPESFAVASPCRTAHHVARGSAEGFVCQLRWK